MIYGVGHREVDACLNSKCHCLLQVGIKGQTLSLLILADAGIQLEQK